MAQHSPSVGKLNGDLKRGLRCFPLYPEVTSGLPSIVLVSVVPSDLPQRFSSSTVPHVGNMKILFPTPQLVSRKFRAQHAN